MLPSSLGDPASNLQFLVPAYPKHVISANDESTENYPRLGVFFYASGRSRLER